MRKLFVSLLMAAFAAASVSAYSADPNTQPPPQKQAKKKKKSAGSQPSPPAEATWRPERPQHKVVAILRVRQPPAAEQSPARRRPGQVEASNHCHAPSKPIAGVFFIYGGTTVCFVSKLHIG